MSNKYEATFHPSDGPTDQGAREALVEQLAEAIDKAACEALDECAVVHREVDQIARAVLPLLEDHAAAQVEAAVSVVRANGLDWMRRYEAAQNSERALREGLKALADEWGSGVIARLTADYAARELRALLAPSPAERTGETEDERISRELRSIPYERPTFESGSESDGRVNPSPEDGE